MTLMTPMSLKLLLQRPGVHNACHTTLSPYHSCNGDLFFLKGTSIIKYKDGGRLRLLNQALNER